MAYSLEVEQLAPEILPSPKENRLPTIIVQWLCQTSGVCYHPYKTGVVQSLTAKRQDIAAHPFVQAHKMQGK